MFENVTAFIVEDDAHSLIVIGSILKELGIHYKRDTSGSAVVAKVRAMLPAPAFILLDMDLPRGNPLEILSDLKSDPDLAQIPVIGIADRSLSDLRSQSAELGFDGFMSKPLPRREFVALINHLLAAEETPREV